MMLRVKACAPPRRGDLYGRPSPKALFPGRKTVFRGAPPAVIGENRSGAFFLRRPSGVVTDHAAGGGAGEGLVLVYDLSVHDHVVDALGDAVGVVVGGGILEPVKVEQHQIRVIALPDEALVLDQQILGGEAGHLVDRLLQGQDALLLHEIGDGMGEGPAGPGMALFLPAAGEAVAAHDAVGIPDDLAHVLIAHAAVYAAGGAVVLHAQVKEGGPGILAHHFGVFGDVPALGQRRLGRGVDIHAVPAAGVQVIVVIGRVRILHFRLKLGPEGRIPQLIGHGGEAVFKMPGRHTGVEGGHVPGVGILVADHPDALVVGIVDQLQGLLLLAPVGLAQHLVVGDVHPDTGLAAHIDGLLHRVHNEVGLVPHVAGVDAVEGLNDLGQLDDFLFLGVAAGGIDQARGETGRAGFHGLPQNALHGVQLLVRGGTVGHSHDGNAQGAVADVHLGVGGEALAVGILQEPGEAVPVLHVLREPGGAHGQHVLGGSEVLGDHGSHGQSALAHDLGGDALGGLKQMGVLGAQDHVSVGVGVDETGRHTAARRVNDLRRLRSVHSSDQLPVLDAQISIIGGASAAVNDLGILYQDIQHFFNLLLLMADAHVFLQKKHDSSFHSAMNVNSSLTLHPGNVNDFSRHFSILWNCTRFTPVICELCSSKVFRPAEINVNHQSPGAIPSA